MTELETVVQELGQSLHDLAATTREMFLTLNERVRCLEAAIVDLGGELPDIPAVDDLKLIQEFSQQIEDLSGEDGS